MTYVFTALWNDGGAANFLRFTSALDVNCSEVFEGDSIHYDWLGEEVTNGDGTGSREIQIE
jgi:hypothetical protein